MFYADDGLNSAKSEEAQRSIETTTKLIGENGLQINKRILCNVKERPREIEGIKGINKIRYLELTFINQRDCFKKQKDC